MKPRDFCKKTLLHACVYFTVCTMLMLMLYALLKWDLSRGINPISQVTTLAFSILFAAANICYREATFSKSGRVCLHGLLTVGGAFFCLYFPNRPSGSTASQALVMLFVFALLYALVMGTILCVGARARRVKREESKYESVYKKVYKKK